MVGSTGTVRAERDLAGNEVRPIGAAAVQELEDLIRAGGVDLSLAQRYSVVFVYPGIGAGERYPELSGCTAELCSFADDAGEFARHGIQLVGLTTRPTSAPGDFLSGFPFPIGRLPDDTDSPLVELVDKVDGAYATRRSFVVYPDGSGVRVSDVHDPVAHVRRCFELAIARRLEGYRDAALAHLGRAPVSSCTTMAHTGFLANGADSVSIATVDLHVRLVAKMASPDIVAQEGGYMERINRLLHDAGRARLFPDVVEIRADQRPAYYLMEAANPTSLDRVVFEDDAMTSLTPGSTHLITRSLEKLANLYERTLRPEVPPIAHYHYLERFRAIRCRQDFRDTFALLFTDGGAVDDVLALPVVLGGSPPTRSFDELIALLEERVELLLSPTGAYLHGDVHLKNMLVSEDGSDVVFVDPRIVWDGHEVGDPGFGDPSYDLGTLLHSLHLTSPILRAIEEGASDELLSGGPATHRGGKALVLEPGVLRFGDADVVDWFVRHVERVVPVAVLGERWQPRLHVNAANALFGWLKYVRAVRSREAWLALFGGVVHHLEQAHRLLDDEARAPA